MIELAVIAVWVAMAVIVCLIALIGLADLVWRAWRLLVAPGEPGQLPGESLANTAHPAPCAPAKSLAWWNRPAVTITLRPPE